MNEENKITKLLETCRGKSPFLILTHNHPDPDALASAWALQYLLKEKLQIQSTVAYRGTLGREENRTFKRILKIRAVRLRSSHLEKDSHLALVDCQPGGSSPLPEDARPLVVIDHHPFKKTSRADFIDIQSERGATSTIMVEYLRAADLEVPPPLATGLYYALMSETQHLGRDVTGRDIDAAIFLFGRVKHRLISRIEHPVHNREFFRQLYTALGKTFTYKRFIGARLGPIEYPNFVGQLADLLVSLKRATWCCVCGRYKNTLYLSLRTTHSRGNAGEVLRRIIGDRGSAGGHEMIAGGQVNLKGLSSKKREELVDTIFKELFRKLKLPEDLTPRPLVGDAGED